jgi:hypothetical protein
MVYIMKKEYRMAIFVVTVRGLTWRPVGFLQLVNIRCYKNIVNFNISFSHNMAPTVIKFIPFT